MCAGLPKKKNVATAFSGEGAKRVSGLWHSRGTGLVYTSASLALSSLELFVHLEIEDIGTLFAAVPAEIPEQVPIEVLEESQLPVGWRSSPPPTKLAELGDEWLRARRTAVLAVPSAVIPREKNYLLNPEHSDFQSIRIGPAEDFVLDPRVWKST